MVKFILRPKIIFFTLGLLSGFFTASFIAIDNWAITTYSFNPIIYGLTSEIMGVLTGILFIMLLQSIKITSNIHQKRPLGSLIDPDFTGFIAPSKEFLIHFKYLIYAGFLGGINTFFYFLAINLVDPSIFQPLLQFVTLYLLLFEVILIDKEWPTLIETLAVINVVLGGILLTLSGSLSMNTWYGVFIILGPINLTQIFITYFQQKLRTTKTITGRYMDSLNIRFWFVVFMTISLAVISIPFYEKSMITDFQLSMHSLLPITAMAMSVTFIAYILYIRILAIGKMSIVNAVTSVSVVFSVAFTWLLKKLEPQAFIDVKFDALTTILKLIGAILVIAGIIALSISEVRTFVFIKCKIGYVPTVFEELKKQRITSIALTSGQYDFIISIKVRSIGKMHSLLLKRIEKIPGIERTYSLAVVKQWERY